MGITARHRQKPPDCAIFSLVMAASELSAAAISDGLGTRLIGRKIVYFPSLKSTMAVAREETRRGASDGTVVVADEQTVGRGRLSRGWLSPPGSVSLSVILRPDVSCLPYLIMLAAVAVAGAIEAVTGLKTQLKWPNDVLIGGRKVCGILVESEVSGGVADYAIMGIGINVNIRVADFAEIAPLATSLFDELGAGVSRLRLVRRLLVELDRLYRALPHGEGILKKWRQRLMTLGRRVRVVSGDDVYEGVAESVDDDGSLLLRCDDGSRRRVLAGDVSISELGADNAA